MTPIPIACSCGRAPVLYPLDPPVRCLCGRRWDYCIPNGSDGTPRAVEIPFRVQPLLAMDLDGTVRRSKSGAKFGPTDAGDVELYPDVEAKLWEYRDRGFRVVGVSNQGVVGYGTRTEVEVIAIATATCAAFQRDPFDGIEMAYALPASMGGKVSPFHLRSLRRKPHYGMLVNIERIAYEANVVVDWDNSIFVGDRDEDKQCAEAAGVAFQWAHNFFERDASAAF